MNLLKKTLMACCTFTLAVTAISPLQGIAKTYEVSNTTELSKVLQKEYTKLTPEFDVVFSGDTATFLPTVMPLAQTIVNTYDSPHALVHRYGVSSSSTANKATLTFNTTYFTTAAKQKKADAKIKSVVATIKKKNKSKPARIKAVNDYIVKNTKYSTSKSTKYSAYGVLYDKQAVCQGYAYTAYLMLKALDYNVKYVTGTGRGVAHAWVMVKIGKNWYHLDTTFNDPVPDRKNVSSYSYYLVSDKNLSKTHVWDTTKYPKASKNYNR